MIPAIYYLCKVQIKRKIISYFLLTTYLLVVAHQSVSPTYTFELNGDFSSQPSHQHEEFQGKHHEHRFHIGVFHFLGHLLEKINLGSDKADDHLVAIQNYPKKKIINNKGSIHDFFSENNLVLIEVDAESLPDPPDYYLPYLQRLKNANLLLRAPPSIV